MLYHVEHKSSRRGKWKLLRVFATRDEAMSFAASLDQDGIITPDVRVVAR